MPFDFKKESKRKGVDVLQTVERIAAEMVQMTGFFCSMRNARTDALPVRCATPHAPPFLPPDFGPRASPPPPETPEPTEQTPPASAEAEALQRLRGPAHALGGAGAGQTMRHAMRLPQSAGGRPSSPGEEGEAGGGGGGGSEARGEGRGKGGGDDGAGDGEEEEEEEDDDDDLDEDEEDLVGGPPHPTSQSPPPPLGGSGDGGGGGGGSGAVWQRQHGVVRTNCIDCLDRTNVAQFCIGRCLLKQQLTVLGFAAAGETLEAPGRVLMNMYEEMGTQIALQYGGSQALHAPNSNAAKDFLQSVKRFYRNTFTDVQKQL